MLPEALSSATRSARTPLALNAAGGHIDLELHGRACLSISTIADAVSRSRSPSAEVTGSARMQSEMQIAARAGAVMSPDRSSK
jgi:hypothetical protein